VSARPDGVRRLASALSVSPSLLLGILAQPRRFYRLATIPKPDGSVRKLHVPDDSLKAIQRALLRQVLSVLDSHSANHCSRGRSVITNAKVHVGSKYGACYDIADCYPSTTPTMVRRALRQRGIESDLIGPIAGLCTLRQQLPQGAPTSPALLSAVLRPLDDALTNGAARHGLKYTRYMDDLFVSSGRRVGSFDRLVRQSVASLGYHLAPGKTRYWGPNSRPTLAGVVLDTTPSPRPEYVTAVVRLVMEAARRPRVARAKDVVQLKGRIAWIAALWPRKGDELRRLLREAGL
jgi:RNA-directed DNA polymerase